MQDLTRAKQNIIAIKNMCGTYKAMYEKLNNKTPTRRDTQTFTNNINRGVYKAEFIISLIHAFDLHDITLGEFYLGDITPKLEKLKVKNEKNSS